MANKKTKIDSKSRYNKHFSAVANGYVYLTLCLFPLFYTRYYFNILETKYAFYWISTISLFVVLIGMLLYYKWDDTVAYFQKFSLKDTVKKWMLPDYLMLGFWLTAVISTLLSDYKLEAFWGNNGRYSGLFLITLYCVAYFVITRLAKFRARMIDAFLITGTLAGLFGITDYFKMDLLHFKVNMKPDQMASYTSTIGNINTYTAYIALIMAVSFVLFATSKNVKKMIAYYLCYIISLFAIIMGVSDNAYLSLAALFGLAPLFLFATKTGVRRYLTGVLSFFVVMKCIAWINTTYPDKVLGINSSFNTIVGMEKLLLVMGCLLGIILCLWIYAFVKKENSHDGIKPWLRWIWLAVVLLAAGGVAYSIYDATVLGNGERYGVLRSYLEFNDEWGTHRGYIWRMGMELYNEFPISKKLFGHGPDTYGMLTVAERYIEMLERYNVKFDSAHNEYLHYLVTMGVFGVVTYTGLFVTSVITYVKRGLHSPYVMAICFAVICYAAQAVVNINLPIATPIVLTLLMIGLAECWQTKKVSGL